MGIYYIEHNNKKVLYIDFTKCKSEKELLNVLEEVKKEFEELPGNFITINDFNNTYVTSKFMEMSKKYAKEIFDKKTEKSAILGIKGIKKVLLNAYNLLVSNKQVPFDDINCALDYLTK